MIGSPRPRKCKTCREPFTPANSLQRACSIRCAIEQGRATARRAARKETAERKVKLRTRRDWIKRAQVAFNAFIRERDKAKPCICCGRVSNDNDLITGSRWDAGHYRSTGSAPHLRFVEDNCHRQLVACNRHGAGRAVDYRLGLIKRIGLARVEALEADQAPRKYTIPELQEIERKYKAMARELRR